VLGFKDSQMTALPLLDVLRIMTIAPTFLNHMMHHCTVLSSAALAVLSGDNFALAVDFFQKTALSLLELLHVMTLTIELTCVNQCTISSGAALAVSSGGNFALALMLTVICSTVGVFTVPIMLDQVFFAGREDVFAER